jgi:hypothetical protein
LGIKDWGLGIGERMKTTEKGETREKKNCFLVSLVLLVPLVPLIPMEVSQSPVTSL